MKRILITLTILLFTCSFAFAQKEITINEECVFKQAVRLWLAKKKYNHILIKQV